MFKSSVRKPHGHIILTGECGDVKEIDTKQCCHCGNHFAMIKGSGKLRGYCMKCDEITCGKIACCKCVPFEKKLDLIESGQKIIL